MGGCAGCQVVEAVELAVDLSRLPWWYSDKSNTDQQEANHVAYSGYDVIQPCP